MAYTEETISRAAEAILSSDALLISASNGLSITEGLHIFEQGPSFTEVFPEVRRRYGIGCILQGMMARWPTDEERWGFWSRLIGTYSAGYVPSETMANLRRIAEGRPTFVVTSNGEGHFTQSGFGEDQVFEVEGNWRTMRCMRGCHPNGYDSMPAVARMAAAERDCVVPSDLMPTCPRCGGPMAISFEPDPGKQELLSEFLSEHSGSRITVLELGIGSRNRLIKAPLMDLVAREPEARYVTVNLGDLYIPASIADRSVGIDGRIDDALRDIAERMGSL